MARVVGEDKPIRPIHVGEQANIDQVLVGTSMKNAEISSESSLGMRALSLSLCSPDAGCSFSVCSTHALFMVYPMFCRLGLAESDGFLIPPHPPPSCSFSDPPYAAAPHVTAEHDAGRVCGILRDVHQARASHPQHDFSGVQVGRCAVGRGERTKRAALHVIHSCEMKSDTTKC